MPAGVVRGGLLATIKTPVLLLATFLAAAGATAQETNDESTKDSAS